MLSILAFLHFKPVAYAPYGLNVLGLGRIVFYLFTYLLYMHGDRGYVSDGVHIPYLPEELLLGKNMVGMFCKEGKQIKLLGGKLPLLAGHFGTGRRFFVAAAAGAQ